MRRVLLGTKEVELYRMYPKGFLLVKIAIISNIKVGASVDVTNGKN